MAISQWKETGNAIIGLWSQNKSHEKETIPTVAWTNYNWIMHFSNPFYESTGANLSVYNSRFLLDLHWDDHLKD